MTENEALHGALRAEVERLGVPIRVAFELGSRDLQDSFALAREFGCHCYAFDCNPDSRQRMAEALALAAATERSRVTVVERAVNETSGTCRFYPVVGHRNIGASSLYRNVRSGSDIEFYPQGEPIEVACTRLDDFCREAGLSAVDLVWSDLQGADLVAIESLGALVSTVRVVLMELEYVRIYDRSVLFEEAQSRMERLGFRLAQNIPRNHNFGNAIFVRPDASSPS